MNKERLLILADYMEKQVDPETYDQDTFGRFNDIKVKYEPVDDHSGVLLAPEGFCGTAACIAGHACFIPSFYEAGLRMNVHVYKGAISSGIPSFEGLSDFPAMAKFFDIPLEHTEVLFNQEGGLTTDFYGIFTPQNVAAKLREYVEDTFVMDNLILQDYEDSSQESWDDESWLPEDEPEDEFDK